MGKHTKYSGGYNSNIIYTIIYFINCALTIMPFHVFSCFGQQALAAKFYVVYQKKHLTARFAVI